MLESLKTVSIFQPEGWEDYDVLTAAMRATKRLHKITPFISQAKHPHEVNDKYEYSATEQMGGVLHQYKLKG